MTLSSFIKEHLPDIDKTWQAELRISGVAQTDGTLHALRSHAGNLLRALACDLTNLSSLDAYPSHEEVASSPSLSQFASKTVQAVQEALCQIGSFDFIQFSEAFSALRNTILDAFLKDQECLSRGAASEDIVLFNRLVDEVLKISALRFTRDMVRERNALLVILAHDLRTPVGGIKMAVDYLSMTGLLGEKQLSAVASINRCASIMSAAISDLAEYAKAGLGAAVPAASTVSLHTAEINVSDICKESLAEVSAMHPDCEFRYKESGSLTGCLDGPRLRRAFSNLLQNAVRSGTRRLPIDFSARGEEDDIIIEVTSHGPVFSDRELQAAFDPMCRALIDQEKSGGMSSVGGGIGLFVANQIIAAHGGKIEALSSEAQGTVFAAIIPRAYKSTEIK